MNDKKIKPSTEIKAYGRKMREIIAALGSQHLAADAIQAGSQSVVWNVAHETRKRLRADTMQRIDEVYANIRAQKLGA